MRARPRAERDATSTTTTWFTVIVLVAASACSGATAGPAPEQPPEPQPVEADPLDQALRDPARFDCSADGDCTNSCGLGAVNADWYRTIESLGYSECEDGCADASAAPPRCERGGCVAYMRDPQGDSIYRRDGCTRPEPR